MQFCNVLGSISHKSSSLGWGYQDFSSVLGTSITLSDNENGEGIIFDSARIVSSTAVVVRTLDPDTFAYSGALRLFSTKISVLDHTGTAITLNAIPHASWGDIRVYFLYNYASLPKIFTLAPAFIRNTNIVEIDNLFVTEEELTAMMSATFPLDHTSAADITNVGTNTHSQIDSHIGSTSNPHSVTLIQVGAEDQILIGNNTNSIGAEAIVIGKDASASKTSTLGTKGIAIGVGASCVESYGIAMGRSAIADYLAIAIGYGANASYDYSMAFGYNAVASANGEMVFGGTGATLAKFNPDTQMEGSSYIKHKASAGADKAGYIQLWAKNDDTLYYTKSDGTDVYLGAAGGSALEIYDEAVSLDTAVSTIKFLGAGVSAVENGDHIIEVTIAGGAGVGVSGTPVDNQLAVWTNASTVEGTANLTYDGTRLIAKSTGANSCSIGPNSEASGAGAVVIGGNSTTSGDYTTIVGYDSDCLAASCSLLGSGINIANIAYTNVAAMGKTIAINGSASVAMGSTVTVAQYCVAVGAETTSSGANGCVAVGRQSVASGSSSIAIGYSPDATNTGTIAIGNATQATGLRAIALGLSSNASGQESVAIGDACTASGTGTIALGDGTTAIGTYSIGIGRDTQVAAITGGIGIGNNCDVDQNYGISIGNTITKAIAAGAIQISSFSGGGGGENSVGIGYGTVASGTHGIALGRGAVASGTYSFACGYSADATADRSYAFGHDAQCSVAYGFAFGANANCTGDSGVALGRVTVCSGAYGVAIGYHADATSNQAIAIGLNAQATTASDVIAIGNAANASHTNSVALGKSAASTLANQIVLGDTTNTSIYCHGVLVMQERASNLADVAGYHQLWVSADGVLHFTLDDGTEYTIDKTAV